MSLIRLVTCQVGGGSSRNNLSEDVQIAVFDIQGREVFNESRDAINGILELKLGAKAGSIYKVILYCDEIKVDEQSLEIVH